MLRITTGNSRECANVSDILCKTLAQKMSNSEMHIGENNDGN